MCMCKALSKPIEERARRESGAQAPGRAIGVRDYLVRRDQPLSRRRIPESILLSRVHALTAPCAALQTACRSRPSWARPVNLDLRLKQLKFQRSRGGGTMATESAVVARAMEIDGRVVRWVNGSL